MLRDIILADIPVVLRRGRIYATAAIVGIMVYVGLQGLGVMNAIAAPISMAIIAALRFAALRVQQCHGRLGIAQSGGGVSRVQEAIRHPAEPGTTSQSARL